MTYIDMHCDSLLSAVEMDKTDIYENPVAMLDVKRLQDAGVLAQFFAIFFGPKEDAWIKRFGSDEAYFNKLYQIYQNTLQRYPNSIRSAGKAEDIESNRADHCVSAFLTLEDGRMIQGNIENLKKVYEKGIRLITLTWNFENCFGFPNATQKETMNKGLKPFGMEAIEEMNRLGIIVDVSHLSDGGFYDVAQRSKKPFAASHSNARSLCPHPRNLTDDMIKTLGESGGIAGLNFAGFFLNPDINDVTSSADRMVKHLSHMVNKGGEDIIALGSDFDGFDGKTEINEPSKVENIVFAMQKVGFSGRQIDKFIAGNAMRFLKAVL